MEPVVAGEGDESAPPRGEGEEYLHSRISPHLEGGAGGGGGERKKLYHSCKTMLS